MSETQDPINERINFLINEFEEGVRRRFALKVGVSAGMVTDLFSERKNKPGIDMVRKILVAYPQISTSWLLLGEGDMLKKEAPLKNNVVHAAQAAGENSIAAGLVVQDRAGGGLGDYSLGKPTTPKRPATLPPPAAASAPTGIDLLYKVEAHEQQLTTQAQELAELRAAVEQLQHHETK